MEGAKVGQWERSGDFSAFIRVSLGGAPRVEPGWA